MKIDGTAADIEHQNIGLLQITDLVTKRSESQLHTWNLSIKYMNKILSLRQRSFERYISPIFAIKYGSGANRAAPCIALLLATVAAYFIFNALTQPALVIDGGMWAEMATNYYTAAASPSWWIKLFTTDAGYIPVPQRLIALFGWALGLPSVAIPYFYTCSGMLCSALMIGIFCLAPFRKLIASDALRFAVCLVVLLMTDFETKTFINFSYHTAFFAMIISALALADHENEVPKWTWFIPIAMVSKPAVLAVLPAMIVVAFFSLSRFRYITLATVTLCLAQLVQIAVSHSAGVMMKSEFPDPGLLVKGWNAARYFLGFLGGYLVGPSLFLETSRSSPHVLIVIGILLFTALAAWVMFARFRGSALIVISTSVVMFTVLLNSFALYFIFNRTMNQLVGLPVYRYTIPGVYACVLIIAAVIGGAISSNSSRSSIYTSGIGLFVFLAWFVASGWYTVSMRLSKEWPSPVIRNSQWTKLARAIDSTSLPLCIPIDPFGWIWKRNCDLLNKQAQSSWGQPQAYKSIGIDSPEAEIEFLPPPEIRKNSLQSIGILMRPAGLQTANVHAVVSLTLASGQTKVFQGESLLSEEGGLMYVSGVAGDPVVGVVSARLRVDTPVQLAVLKTSSKVEQSMLWMGIPQP